MNPAAVVSAEPYSKPNFYVTFSECDRNGAAVIQKQLVKPPDDLKQSIISPADLYFYEIRLIYLIKALLIDWEETLTDQPGLLYQLLELAMFIPVASAAPPAFSKQTLVLPVISKGNVGQLACDLLIASLSLERIGFLDSSTLVPVIGSREDGVKGVSTPLEVFSKAGSKIVVVQQRSPVLKSHKTQFVHSLLAWIRVSNFQSVIVLAGMDTTNRSDSQMHTPTYTLIPPSSPPLPPPQAEALSILESYKVEEKASEFAQKSSDTNTVPPIPGGGLARRIFASLNDPADGGGATTNWSVPIVVILHYVFEGDNRGDAGMLLAIVNRAVELKIQAVKEPSSWSGLFGPAHDGSLFG